MLSFNRTFAKSTASTLKPLFDRVLLTRIEVPSKTNSGIYIPESLKGKHNEAIVLSVGQGRREKDGSFIPLTLKPGDRVVLSDWGGNEIKLDGKEYLLLREDDILGLVQ